MLICIKIYHNLNFTMNISFKNLFYLKTKQLRTHNIHKDFTKNVYFATKRALYCCETFDNLFTPCFFFKIALMQLVYRPKYYQINDGWGEDESFCDSSWSNGQFAHRLWWCMWWITTGDVGGDNTGLSMVMLVMVNHSTVQYVLEKRPRAITTQAN